MITQVTGENIKGLSFVQDLDRTALPDGIQWNRCSIVRAVSRIVDAGEEGAHL